MLAPNATARNGLVSRRSFDLTDGSVEVEIDSRSGPRGPRAEAGFEVRSGGELGFSIALEQGMLTARLDDHGTVSNTTVPYDFGDHRLWRLRHEAATGLVHFETSDSSTTAWTALRSEPAPAAVTALSVALYGHTYDFGNPGPGTIGFDDLRLTTAACP